MFPYRALEEWFGADFSPRLPDDVKRLTREETVALAEHLRAEAMRPEALPRATRAGELRPNVATMRTLDAYWGPGNLMDRVCTLLTYASAATAFDPVTFTVEEWATAPDPTGNAEFLRDVLPDATRLLVELRPLVTSGALDLLPPSLTRDFAGGLPAIEIDPDLMTRYSASGLNDKIGDLNRDLGGRHPTGRFGGYQHLWEILQDLILAERHPEILQPLFVAGFDADLAGLLLERPTLPTEDHVAALAAFRFPTHQVTARKVAQLRDLDEFRAWWQALSIALTNVNLRIQTLAEAQAFVHETLTPPAQALVRSLGSDVWGSLRRTGTERLVIGALTSFASAAAGGNLATSLVSGATGASLSAAWSAFGARARRTELDVPFLSMTPDADGRDLVAIPALGPLF